jgi:pterin-4a-carbinolamine dehydratase
LGSNHRKTPENEEDHPDCQFVATKENQLKRITKKQNMKKFLLATALFIGLTSFANAQVHHPVHHRRVVHHHHRPAHHPVHHPAPRH